MIYSDHSQKHLSRFLFQTYHIYRFKECSFTMRDSSAVMNTTWPVVTTLMYVNGALGVVLLTKQVKVDIPLIIFTAFEWLAAILSTLCFLTYFTTLAKTLLLSLWLANTFCVIASTTMGIYWIDNIVLENVIIKSLYLRQIKVCLITLFIISVLFKFLIFIRAFSQSKLQEKGIREDHAQNDLETHVGTDKESSKFGSTLSDSIPSSKVNAVKVKDSVVTLVSKQSDGNNKSSSITKSQEDTANTDNLKQLNLKYAELFKMPSRSDTLDTTDLSNSTPNMIFRQKPLTNASFKQSQILEQNNVSPDIPSTPIISNFSNHITEEDLSVESVLIKNSDYQFPQNSVQTSPYKFHQSNYNFILEKQEHNIENDEEQNIQALNISEPIHENNFSQAITSNGKTFHNISLQAWNETSKKFMENNDYIIESRPPRMANFKNSKSLDSLDENLNVESSVCDIHSFSSDSNNCLYEELNREIKENGSHHTQIQMQQSLPNLRLSSRHSRLNRGGSVSKIMSLNTSSLRNKSSSNSLSLVHQKSSSLSAIPMSKSRSHSPLKKFKDLKGNLQFTPHTPKQTRSSSPSTLSMFELDLNLANSIRKSPAKKLSSRSLNSKNSTRKISFASPTRNNPNASMFELAKNSPTGFGYNSNIIPEGSGAFLQANIEKGSPSDKKNRFTKIVDDYIVHDIIKSQRVFSGVSGISGTDKSTTSNNSVPSGYYGEYDKEKWRVFKKVKNGIKTDFDSTLDLSFYNPTTP